MTTTPDSFMINDTSSIMMRGGGKPKINVSNIKFKKPETESSITS